MAFFKFCFTNQLKKLSDVYIAAVQELIELTRRSTLIPFCDQYNLKFENGNFYSASSEQPIDYERDTGEANLSGYNGDKNIPPLPLELLEMLNSTTLTDGRSIWHTMPPYIPENFGQASPQTNSEQTWVISATRLDASIVYYGDMFGYHHLTHLNDATRFDTQNAAKRVVEEISKLTGWSTNYKFEVIQLPKG